MALRNRVDPWGDLRAVPVRGMFTGNRGSLVDSSGDVVRHHKGTLWIICVTEFGGGKQPLSAPGRWTPLFFMDEAVGLAAGHRPCGYCRVDAYDSFRAAAARAAGQESPFSASELNRRLGKERLAPGRGLDRARDRRVWTADISSLPVGTVIVGTGGEPRLVTEGRLLEFSFDGWRRPVPRPSGGQVGVLTPPTSVGALMNGFSPVIHPTADLS